MKAIISLLLIGNAITFFLMQTKGSQPSRISYEEVNSQSVKEISEALKFEDNSRKNQTIQNAINNLTTIKEYNFHNREGRSPFASMAGVMILWSAVLVGGYVLARRKMTQSSDGGEAINPTFKRIMSDLDYPLVMVDQGLNIIWQNKSAATFDFDTEQLQKIFKSDSNGAGEVLFNSKSYTVSISDLKYKSGKVHFLAQIKPNIVATKNFDHLIDMSEVSQILETQLSKSSSGFGDVNQSLAKLSVSLGYLFKITGKYLDLDFKKDISDCFIESARLDGMLKDFVMSCHHMIKDDFDLNGVFIRTDENGNKFSVSCFLSNFNKESIDNHPLMKDVLRRFSILEAKYAICNPAIDFNFVETAKAKGLDITLNFENKSELETIVGRLGTNA